MESTTTEATGTVEFRITGYAHPDAQALSAEVQQEYVRRYGGPDDTVMRAEDFEAPSGLFLIAYLDGRPVACGGWRAKQGGLDGLRDGDAELKRMFVIPDARGRGLARAVLHRLEEAAVEAGRTRLILETGTEQPEAVALYGSEGYVAIRKYGMYKDHPQSICLGKEVAAAA
ncbi:GNAT family N-acetyltransferase [Streptomyces sp. CBMA123]|uniref:GNAT family N-acetyltransferase n=1 Tax=Streptomyces sp. CBMA123 TaxID=1896313 RepID=UPI0016619935|nr:GNAT family N-acetyltransferase [Streptomyces sp. CBMA123]MBD0691207.1 GNAT family N-acetyltransferase [Streptomyces sp. CBMA123]